MLQSRCGNYSENVLYRLLYEKRELIDGFDKNMSIWCVRDWPYFKRKRDVYIQKYASRTAEFKDVRAQIIKRIKKSPSINSRDIGDSSKVHWSWAPTSIGRAVLESMYHCGELIIHHKEGTRKYYGLADNLLPEKLRNQSDPNATLEEYQEWYVKRRIGAIGLLWNKSGDAWLGTKLKVSDRSNALARLLEKDEITEIRVGGIDEILYALTEGLPLMNRGEKCSEASIIAPLDNLIWDRKLISALFQFDYKWEVYTPVKDRRYGYYVLPILYGDRIVGRFEPVLDRKKAQLVIKNWWWEDPVDVKTAIKGALIRCFKDFAKFLGIRKISMAENRRKNNIDWLTYCSE